MTPLVTLPLSKLIDVEDFDAPELAPYLQEIAALESARGGMASGPRILDPKQWQCAMTLRVLDRERVASPGHLIAAVGAGTEATLFALARRGAVVFAVDRYLERTAWSDVAPAGMLIDPLQYSPTGHPRGHVIPVHSSALALNLPSGTFDAVFSNGAIEHFGSLANVAIAAREIGRILKPGGVATIATEFRVDGPDDRRWFDNDTMLFTPELLQRHVVQPSGLVARDPLVTVQSDRTFETRRNLVDFPDAAKSLQALDEKRTASPSLVVYHDGFLFCSVVLTLFKDDPSSGPADDDNARARVQRENAALAAALERFQRTPDGTGVTPDQNHLLFGEVERLRTENDALRALYDRSNAWKQWRALRPARFVYRRLKRWRG